MILRDLTKDEGLRDLLAATGGTDSFFNYPERIQGVRDVAQRAIDATPAIANTKVRVMPNIANAYYDYESNEILLGLVNPDALAHELGHASNLRQKGLYTKILRTAQGVAKINNIAAVPVMLGLRTMVKDKAARDDILNALSAVSSAAAAPMLLEEATASIQALYNAPDKLQALKTLAPAFLAHAGMSLAPVGIYQAGKI